MTNFDQQVDIWQEANVITCGNRFTSFKIFIVDSSQSQVFMIVKKSGASQGVQKAEEQLWSLRSELRSTHRAAQGITCV